MGFSGISYYYAVHITILATSHVPLYCSFPPLPMYMHVVNLMFMLPLECQCAVSILLLHPSHRFSSSGDEAQTIV